MIMELKTGLMAFTKGHRLRALTLVGPRGLFTSQIVKDVNFTAFYIDGKFENIEDEYLRLLPHYFSPIMAKVARLSESPYYTFLGKYVYDGESFRYEPYVDLMKTAIVVISEKYVRVIYGEKKVRLRRAKKSGIHPRDLLELFARIITKLHGGSPL